MNEYFMREALKEAKAAFDRDETPVGCVITCGTRIVARAHNLVETLNDPTAHAEMQAITAATHTIGGKYLSDCTLYVTLEPCPMCAGALFWSQIGKIVFGAADPKRGFSLAGAQLLHPKTVVEKGVLAGECAQLLKHFFQSKRP
ncbi:MAG: nucleoside deaminase [Prevotellaceae bacterium]|jgi:tRNA(adenine34) deaminase|nr:nucleoside deaminase [Prevotellaceae bacterium]